MYKRQGQSIALSQISSGTVSSGQISYARVNWAGQVDLIVLNGAADETVIYGRAVVKNDQVQVEDKNGKAPGEEGYIPTYRTTSTVEVQYGAGKTTGPIKAGYAVRTGDYVAVTLSKDGKSITCLLYTSRVFIRSAAAPSAHFHGHDSADRLFDVSGQEG